MENGNNNKPLNSKEPEEEVVVKPLKVLVLNKMIQIQQQDPSFLENKCKIQSLEWPLPGELFSLLCKYEILSLKVLEKFRGCFLQEIIIYDVKGADDSWLNELSKWNYLKHLEICNISKILTLNGFEHLSLITSLETLNLRNEVENSICYNAMVLNSLVKLKRLSLDKVNLTCLDKIFFSLTNLVSLKICSPVMKLEDPLLTGQTLTHLIQLQVLELNNIDFSEEDLKPRQDFIMNFWHRKFIPDRSHFRVPFPSISQLTSLKVLNLYNTNVSEEQLKTWTKLTNLTALELSATQITNESIPYLHHFPKLIYFACYGTDISSEQVDKIPSSISLFLRNDKTVPSLFQLLSTHIHQAQFIQHILEELPYGFSPNIEQQELLIRVLEYHPSNSSMVRLILNFLDEATNVNESEKQKMEEMEKLWDPYSDACRILVRALLRNETQLKLLHVAVTFIFHLAVRTKINGVGFLKHGLAKSLNNFEVFSSSPDYRAYRGQVGLTISCLANHCIRDYQEKWDDASLCIQIVLRVLRECEKETTPSRTVLFTTKMMCWGIWTFASNDTLANELLKVDPDLITFLFKFTKSPFEDETKFNALGALAVLANFPSIKKNIETKLEILDQIYEIIETTDQPSHRDKALLFIENLVAEKSYSENLGPRFCPLLFNLLEKSDSTDSLCLTLLALTNTPQNIELFTQWQLIHKLLLKAQSFLNNEENDVNSCNIVLSKVMAFCETVPIFCSHVYNDLDLLLSFCKNLDKVILEAVTAIIWTLSKEDSLKESLFKSNIYLPMIEFLNREECTNECWSYIAYTCLNLAVHGDQFETIYIHLLNDCTTITETRIPGFYRKSLEALSLLASYSHIYTLKAFSMKTVDKLFQVLEKLDPKSEISEKILFVLARLAESSDKKSEKLEIAEAYGDGSKWIKLITPYLLPNQKEAHIINSLNLLDNHLLNLSHEEKTESEKIFTQEFLNCGFIQLVLQFLEDKYPPYLRDLSDRVLSNFLKDTPRNKKKFLECGGLHKAFRVWVSTNCNPPCSYNMINFSGDKELQYLYKYVLCVDENNPLDILITFLESNLQNNHLRGGDPFTKHRAVACLGVLSRLASWYSPEISRIFIQKNIHTLCYKILLDEQVFFDVAQYAAFALRDLCVNEKSKIQKCNFCFESILTGTRYKLKSSSNSKTYMCNTCGQKELSTNPSLESSIKVKSNFKINEQSSSEILRKSGMLAQLLETCTEIEKPRKIEAILLVIGPLCSANPSCRQVIIFHKKFLQKLAAILRTSNDSSLIEQTLSCLADISQHDPKFCKELIQYPDFIESFLNHCRNPQTEQNSVVLSLELDVAFKESGLLKYMVDWLKSNNYQEQWFAARNLYNLKFGSMWKSICEELRNMNVISNLIDLIFSSEERIRDKSITLIESFPETLFESFIQILVSLLKPSTLNEKLQSMLDKEKNFYSNKPSETPKPTFEERFRETWIQISNVIRTFIGRSSARANQVISFGIIPIMKEIFLLSLENIDKIGEKKLEENSEAKKEENLEQPEKTLELKIEKIESKEEKQTNEKKSVDSKKLIAELEALENKENINGISTQIKSTKGSTKEITAEKANGKNEKEKKEESDKKRFVLESLYLLQSLCNYNRAFDLIRDKTFDDRAREIGIVDFLVQLIQKPALTPELRRPILACIGNLSLHNLANKKIFYSLVPQFLEWYKASFEVSNESFWAFTGIIFRQTEFCYQIWQNHEKKFMELFKAHNDDRCQINTCRSLRDFMLTHEQVKQQMLKSPVYIEMVVNIFTTTSNSDLKGYILFALANFLDLNESFCKQFFNLLPNLISEDFEKEIDKEKPSTDIVDGLHQILINIEGIEEFRPLLRNSLKGTEKYLTRSLKAEESLRVQYICAFSVWVRCELGDTLFTTEVKKCFPQKLLARLLASKRRHEFCAGATLLVGILHRDFKFNSNEEIYEMLLLNEEERKKDLQEKVELEKRNKEKEILGNKKKSFETLENPETQNTIILCGKPVTKEKDIQIEIFKQVLKFEQEEQGLDIIPPKDFIAASFTLGAFLHSVYRFPDSFQAVLLKEMLVDFFIKRLDNANEDIIWKTLSHLTWAEAPNETFSQVLQNESIIRKVSECARHADPSIQSISCSVISLSLVYVPSTKTQYLKYLDLQVFLKMMNPGHREEIRINNLATAFLLYGKLVDFEEEFQRSISSVQTNLFSNLTEQAHISSWHIAVLSRDYETALKLASITNLNRLIELVHRNYYWTQMNATVALKVMAEQIPAVIEFLKPHFPLFENLKSRKYAQMQQTIQELFNLIKK